VLLPDISQAADAGRRSRRSCWPRWLPPARAGEHRLHLSASVGITIYPEDAEDAQTLISRADAAMYRSKRRGPGGFEFYAQKAVDDPALARRAWPS
jgi:GGDEF domain-containing protein